jgi:hypothetical protein
MSIRFIDRIVLLALWLMLSPLATAGIAYDNGGPDQANGGIVNNELAAADDFLLIKQTNLISAKFWTLEEVVPGTGPGSAWDGTLIYGIYADDNGSIPPGLAPISEYGQNIVKQATANTSVTIDGVDYAEFMYTFDIVPGVSLAPGTYWLALFLQEFGTGSDFPAILWGSTASTSQNSANELGAQGWEPLDYDLAFVLFDEEPAVVSLPTTWLLLLPLLGFLGFRTRRPARTGA